MTSCKVKGDQMRVKEMDGVKSLKRHFLRWLFCVYAEGIAVFSTKQAHGVAVHHNSLFGRTCRSELTHMSICRGIDILCGRMQ